MIRQQKAFFYIINEVKNPFFINNMLTEGTNFFKKKGIIAFFFVKLI